MRVNFECKQKRHLKQTTKKPPNMDIRNFFPGTVVDICMRRWLELDDPPSGGMQAMLDEVLEFAETNARETGDGIVQWRDLHDKKRVRAGCWELLGRLEPILRQYALSVDYSPAVRFKEPFILPYLDGTPQQIWLVGEMDLFTRTQPVPDLRVWDLKNTKNGQYWRKTVGQLLFYDLAVWAKHKRWTVECGLIQPMCPEQVLSFQFTDQNRRELMMHLAAFCRDVWLRDTAPKAGTEGCAYCEMRTACVRYAGNRGRVAWPAA
jgi:PD-(D/E)XK nuclease superfamily